MIINCTKCNKNFEVDDDLISLEGTLVQCGSCQYKWYQKKEVVAQKDEVLELENNIVNTDLLNNPKTSTEKDKIKTSSKKIKSQFSEKKKNRLKEIEKIKLEIIQEKKEFTTKKNKYRISNKKAKKVGFFSTILIFLISILAIYIVLDTFQYHITKYWSDFEKYFYYINETLINIYILIKDLIKSYS